MQASPMMRTVNTDWGERAPTLHFTLAAGPTAGVGLTSSAVAQQLQFLLSGIPVTAVREDIRTVQVVARSAGEPGSTRPGSPISHWRARPVSAFRCRRWARSSARGRADHASTRPHADDHRARRHRRRLAAAGRVHRHVQGTPAHRRQAAQSATASSRPAPSRSQARRRQRWLRCSPSCWRLPCSSSSSRCARSPRW